MVEGAEVKRVSALFTEELVADHESLVCELEGGTSLGWIKRQ